MNQLHIFSDFDGTITEQDTLIFLTTRLGGGASLIAEIGQALRAGEMTLRAGIAAEMRSIHRPFSEAVALLRAEVEIDPGFAPLAAWCAQQNIPVTVLSAGFQQIIDLFLPRAEFPHLQIRANELEPDELRGWQCHFRDETDYGHDKAAPLRQAQRRGEHVIFIGDGLSDRAAAEAADEVFAKPALAEYCRAQGINCHEFQTFAEILPQLQSRY
jgi:2,3-diketo-5-methylthio-1-phosphopentane phosphatase